MSNHDWQQFCVRINVNAPAERIYRCWSTREGMEFWFLRFCEYKAPDGRLRAGNEPVGKDDSYTWRWHGWSDDTTEFGRILDCNGRDFLKFSFGNAGDCSMRIRFEQQQHIVELLQENIPDTDEGKRVWHLGCKTGWTFYLANLKSLLEGGIDLRNKDVNLQQMLNS
ncbi:MAG TPA: SRPBCC domain-containing protein [Ferruginibacter sp.]|nr:SRPBCC domain-containing protein [Ferruginibacter sp.]HNG62218.1 SRPBCC domain-containing protein [Ferruginibacter sp.]HNL64402.1 SRPBCC domain-containing protein [Ferruginibacter sp.]